MVEYFHEANRKLPCQVDNSKVEIPVVVWARKVDGGTEGLVFLNPGLRRLMRRYLKENGTQGDCGPGTPLFRANTGRRLGARQIQLRFAQRLKDAGIDRPVSIHSLRHTFATRLYEKTGDLHLVQRALGHRQITTTEVYAKVGDGVLKRAMMAN